MYMHLGNNAVIKTDDIIGVFDLDNTTVSARTRKFLAAAEKRGEVILATDDLPKSFVITSDKKGESKVYLSQLAASTLGRRKGL